MAEYIFKHMMGQDPDIVINSAGLSGERAGDPIYPMAQDCLNARGIPFEERRAVVFKLKDYFEYDYIICMDEMQKYQLKKLCEDDPCGKIYKLLEFSDRSTEGMSKDDAMLYTNVFDPHLDKDFDRAYETICEGLSGFKRFLSKNKDDSAI